MIADRVLLGERGKHGQSPRMKTFHYVRAMQRVSAVSGIVLNKALHLGLPRLRTLWIARYLDINIRKLMCRIGIEVIDRACVRANPNRGNTRCGGVCFVAIEAFEG